MEIKTIPSIIIALVALALVLGIGGAALSTIQSQAIRGTDYSSYTDGNITFYNGTATLTRGYCVSIETVVIA